MMRIKTGEIFEVKEDFVSLCAKFYKKEIFIIIGMNDENHFIVKILKTEYKEVMGYTFFVKPHDIMKYCKEIK